jgi:phenylalanyl-tRNA synthetase alpha subunit
MRDRTMSQDSTTDDTLTGDLQALKTETDAALASAVDLRAWDAIRIAVLGRNGKLTMLLRDLGKTAPELRKERGVALNWLKDALNQAIDARKSELEEPSSAPWAALCPTGRTSRATGTTSAR